MVGGKSQIRYYDTVFDIMESDHMQYEKIRNGEYGRIHFRFYPTVHELECKKEYFKTIQEKKICMIFQKTPFFWYLQVSITIRMNISVIMMSLSVS